MLNSLKTVARHSFLAAVPPTIAQRAQFAWKEPSRRRKRELSADTILHEVVSTGFATIPGFLTSDQCSQAVAEIDGALVEFPDHVHHGADQRLFGFEKVSPAGAAFSQLMPWDDMASEYASEPSETMFVMANRISSGSSEGSGGGWHRDGFARELKAMVYLTDVTTDNGPLQIVRGSHVTDAIYGDMKTGGIGALQNRITNEQVRRVLSGADRAQAITAKAGTAIIFDTSAIHRGMPVVAGTRYAMTVYISATRNVTKATFDHYMPVLNVRPYR